MYTGRIPSLFVHYAIPQMIGLLFNSVYIIVDGVFIGNRLGTDAMAAAAVSVPLVEILIALSIAVASGAGVLVSGNIAQGEHDRALQIFNTACLCALAMSGIVGVMGNLFIQPLSQALGATEHIHEYAIEYMRYIFLFSPFLIFSFLFSGIVRNDGCPKLAMIALTIGSVSNIALDYLFMYPLNMGIGGAALATALGPIFSVLIMLPHFVLKRGNLFFAKVSVRGRGIWRICVLGFPSFIMEFTIGIITFIYNSAIVRHGYGELGLAAYLIIGYLMLIILTIFLGMAEGLQPVFSYFTGSGEWQRGQSIRRFASVIVLLTGFISYLLIAAFSQYFFIIFNPEDITLIEFARRKSLLYFWGFFLAGYNILMISYWQSTGATAKALIISLSRSMIWPPILSFALPALFNREAVWICQSASEAITACTCLVLPLIRRDRDGSQRKKGR